MSSLTSALRIGLRAAVWRTTPDPPTIGLAGLTLWCMLSFAVALVAQYVFAGDDPRFNPYGINSSIAMLAVSLLVPAFFIPTEKRTTALSALLALGIPFGVAFQALVSYAGDGTNFWLWLVHAVWFIGMMSAILRSVATNRHAGQTLRAVGILVATMLALSALPLSPVFTGHGFKLESANLWEAASAAMRRSLDAGNPPRPAIDVARTELSQPALLDAAATRLAPHRSGTTNVFALGIAGWGDQDVFIKELEGGLKVIAKSLPIEGRTLRLINHYSTVEDTPVATRQNFAAAIRAIGRVMDKDEDVLLLFMTSHGFRGGFALQLQGLTYNDLSPEDVATTLDREGIKNRIVIVSACFAGVFIPPLANDDTIVLAAADANSSSFGCSNERDWTYFGDALLNNGLRNGMSLQRAFEGAKSLIAEWEARDGATASNPQAHFGAALLRKLDRTLASAEAE